MASNIIVKNNGPMAIFGDQSIGETFASFNPDDMDGKIKLYNAINSPDERIANCINMSIKMRDVIVKAVKLAADRTGSGDNWTEDGEERDGYRVILIDMDGKSYSATSAGIYNSISTIRTVFGTLHFEDGLNVIVNQVKTKNGNTLTLKITK